MSSKRHLRKRQCGDKIKFRTKEDALRKIDYLENTRDVERSNNTGTATNHLGRAGRRSLVVYECRFCGMFHIGHNPRMQNSRAQYEQRKVS